MAGCVHLQCSEIGTAFWQCPEGALLRSKALLRLKEDVLMVLPDREGHSTPPPIPSERATTGPPPLGSEGKKGGRNPRALATGIILAIAAVALAIYSIGLMDGGETSTTDSGGTDDTNSPTNSQEDSGNGNTLEIEYESTSLHRAAKAGDLALVKRLLGSGPLHSRGDVDVRDGLPIADDANVEDSDHTG